MCFRFQTGSNRPLAKRRARMLSTDSLPRKWSIRNTCDSPKWACTVAFKARAEARSVPNGFSMMIRDPGARPAAPSMPTVGSKAAGGTARWNSRPGAPPIWCSARLMASTSGRVRTGSALANESRRANACQAAPVGLVVPNSATAWRACSRNCSSVMRRREEPMIWYLSGTRPAPARWNSPGSSLRRARSPVAPNMTMTWFPGRGAGPRTCPSREGAGATTTCFPAGGTPKPSTGSVTMVLDMTDAPSSGRAGQRRLNGGAGQVADQVGEADGHSAEQQVTQRAAQEGLAGLPGGQPAAGEGGDRGQGQRGGEGGVPEQVGQQRNQRPGREGGHGCRGRWHRGGKLVLVHPELFPDVDGQCLQGVGGDLPGHGVSESGGET